MPERRNHVPRAARFLFPCGCFRGFNDVSPYRCCRYDLRGERLMMSTRPRMVPSLCCCAALLALGCGDASDTNHVHDDASLNPEGQVNEDDESAVPCTDSHPELSPGLSTTKEGLTLKVVSGEPTGARKKVRNDWILELVDESGAPVTDATFTGPKSYMQAHDHPGLPAPMIVDVAEAGRVKLDNINFSMRGPWEVYVSVERGEKAPVVFQINVCVE